MSLPPPSTPLPRVPSPEEASRDLICSWRRCLLQEKERRVAVRAIKSGWGEVQRGISLCNPVLCLAGEHYADGLATHADSEILVESTEDMTRFQAVAGLDQNNSTLCPPTDTRLIFSVEAQGRQLWRSGELKLESKGVPLHLPLPPGTRQLTLKVRGADGKSTQGHADWAIARVKLSSGAEVKLGERTFPAIPFSFIYDGKLAGELLPSWKQTFATRAGKQAGVTVHTVSWTDPDSGMECRMEISEFADHPALEWVIYFRNGGNAASPILENIQALDLTWNLLHPLAPENVAARIYRSRGSTCNITDFQYSEETLLLKESLQMEAGAGRSSNNWLPFFNLDLGDLGVMTAIGWSGQWACRLAHENFGQLRVVAGMEKTHLKLHPGEEIRTPRILQLFWKQDRLAGHNALRRFILQHHTPHLDGKPITGPFTIGHWGGMKTQEHLDRIAVYRREKLPMDYLWVDAGWYGLNSTYSPDEFLGDWHQHTGDWRVNPKAHPDGLKPIVRAARDAGMKFLLWIEPERAVQGTVWPGKHPDWFLGKDHSLLLNLGKPEALEGAIELVSNLIKEHEVDLYREDFNIDPLDYWRANDAPDRQGITEIGCIVGLYAFWDALLERHPGLIIDNCSSGGRRIDLETIGRSVALWRSDYQCFPDKDVVGSQAQMMGLSYWLPLHGSGTWSSMPRRESVSTYRVRSTMGPTLQLSNFVRESQPIQADYDWDWFRKMCADYLRARPFFVGDYYPLSEPLTTNPQNWAVFQMNRNDLHSGLVMAFRREKTPWQSGSFRLCGLDVNADYEVEDADTATANVYTGKTLSQSGLEIILPLPESAALLFYRKR